MAGLVGQWIDRHPVGAYVVLTFAISWSLFGLIAVLPPTQVLARAGALVAGAFGPMAGAVVLVAVRGAGLRAWARTVFALRAPPRTYVVAVALPVVAVLVAGGVHTLAFGGTPTLADLPPLTDYPLYLLFILVLTGGQEEPGWRGYLLPLLEAEHTPLVAALVVGVIWAVWHLPLFVIPGTTQADLSFPLYVPMVLALSVVLTWLTNVARGSVLPAMVFHAGVNAVLNYYPVGGAAGAVSLTGNALLVGVVVVVGVATVAVAGPGLGASRAGGGATINPAVTTTD